MLRSAPTLPQRAQQTRAFRYMAFCATYSAPSYESEAKRRRALKREYSQVLDRALEWDIANSGFARQTADQAREVTKEPKAAAKDGEWLDESTRAHNRQLLQKLDQRQQYRQQSMYAASNFSLGLEGLPLRSSKTLREDKLSARNLRSEEQLHISWGTSGIDFIDPITNRKVSRKNASKRKGSVEIGTIPVNMSDGRRLTLSNLASTRPTEVSESELDHYKKPFMFNEPDGRQPGKSDGVEQGLAEFDSTEAYDKFMFREPNGQMPEKQDPVQKSLAEFDAAVSYDAVRFNEPDGQMPEKQDPVQKSLEEFDAAVSYDAVRFNEPDGQLLEATDSARDSLKDYERAASYEAFRYNEPFGKLPEEIDPVQKSLKAYDDREYSKSQAVREGYSPYEFNEPNGQLQKQVDPVPESLTEYDNHANYGTRGPRATTKSSLAYPTSADKTEDLDLLRSSDVRASSGILKSRKKETEAEKSAKRRELEVEFEKSQQLADSHAEAVQVGKRVKPDAPTISTTLRKHFLFSPETKAELRGAYRNDLRHKKKSSRMCGNYARDFPEEFETTWTKSDDRLSYGKEVETRMQRAEKTYADELASRRPSAPRLETALDRAKRLTLKNCGESGEMDLYSKVPQGLETGYAEECAHQGEGDLSSFVSSFQNKGSKVYADPLEVDGYSKVPQGLEIDYAMECASQGEGDLSIFVSSYGSPKLRSLGNVQSKGERQQKKQLVQELRSIYEDSYGTIDSQHRQDQGPVGSKASLPEVNAAVKKSTLKPKYTTEPTHYKILVYDVSMQSISLAETSSTVEDMTSPLSPADVLVRLDNPAKFFPHFESLKNQGYEIASGSGDVLVFRKVRTAVSPAQAKSTIKQSRSYVTPIDNMQSAPAATGMADSHESSPFPPNITVRREEPHYSSGSSWTDSERGGRKKMGLMKRVLAGGFAFAGLTYAGGVVSEYFKTGGLDGQGPKGF